MPKFSNKSLAKLEQCHEDLQTLFNEVIKEWDCTIICGYRNEKEQNRAFKAGHSKLQYPKSKHNQIPSLAVDVLPYPIDYGDKKRILEFTNTVKRIANELYDKKIITSNIVWGGDWHSIIDDFVDLILGETKEQIIAKKGKKRQLVDMPHWEIKL